MVKEDPALAKCLCQSCHRLTTPHGPRCTARVPINKSRRDAGAVTPGARRKPGDMTGSDSKPRRGAADQFFNIFADAGIGPMQKRARSKRACPRMRVSRQRPPSTTKEHEATRIPIRGYSGKKEIIGGFANTSFPSKSKDERIIVLPIIRFPHFIEKSRDQALVIKDPAIASAPHIRGERIDQFESL